MNEILVARNELAATLTSSAVAKSVMITGVPAAITGAKAARSCCSAHVGLDAEDQPVGVQGVLDREALAQELGVPGQLDVGDAHSLASSFCIRAAVPAGTVDLPTTSARRSPGDRRQGAGTPAST